MTSYFKVPAKDGGYEWNQVPGRFTSSVKGTVVTELRGEGIDPAVTPTRLVLVDPDGSERVFAIVYRARLERLLKIAKTFSDTEESPGMDGGERWAWMSVGASDVLQPGDLDPLP